MDEVARETVPGCIDSHEHCDRARSTKAFSSLTYSSSSTSIALGLPDADHVHCVRQDTTLPIGNT
jgi:hypothetical protein